MRILRRVGMWAAAGGLMLVLGNAAWGQGTGSGAGAGTGTGTDTGVGPGTGPGTGSVGGHGSLSGQSGVPSPSMPTGSDNIPTISLTPDMEANQVKMRNIDRQKQLVEDTQKLLALANELKADVDKSTKDTLSLDVVKKADEIEKLAHSVKEKMKNAT
jgi:hypothetical protein